MKLNHRITLQRRTGVGTIGQASPTWEDVATVWANVRPLRGREFFAAGQSQSTADAVITVRHRTDVTANWRAVWNGTPYSIVAAPIDVDGAHEFTELMCQTGVADGR